MSIILTVINPVLALALRYHAMGFIVVPVAPRIEPWSPDKVKKPPSKFIKTTEFKAILNNAQSERQVRDLFTRCSDATVVGLATGPLPNEPDQSLVVLDFDSRELFQSMQQDLLPFLKDTWLVETRRGMHVYVRVPTAIMPHHWKAIPQLDIKRSGYVVAPDCADPDYGLTYRFLQGPPTIPRPVLLKSLDALSAFIVPDPLTPSRTSLLPAAASASRISRSQPLWIDMAPERSCEISPPTPSTPEPVSRPPGLSETHWDLLCHNSWQSHGYPSRSEADMAIVLALANQGYNFRAVESLYNSACPADSKYKQHANPTSYLHHTYRQACRFLSEHVSEDLRRYATLIATYVWPPDQYLPTDRRIINTLVHQAQRLRSFPRISISIRELASWARYSPATVQRSLKRLQTQGLLIHSPPSDKQRRLSGTILLTFPDPTRHPATATTSSSSSPPASSSVASPGDCSDIHHPLWSSAECGERGRIFYKRLQDFPQGLTMKDLSDLVSLPRSTLYDLRKRLLKFNLIEERSGRLFAKIHLPQIRPS